MIPNPAWNESVEFQQAKEDVVWHPGECPEDVFPEDYDKALPPDGGWIMLLMSVHVGNAQQDGTVKGIVVPHMSIWYAMPHVSNAKKILGRTSYKRGSEITASLKQAIINTPDGPVHVWPHEYKRIEIEKFLEFSDEDGLHIHFLSESGAFDEAALFYIRSRGISKADAQRMLLASLKDPNYCYFTFAPEITGVFGEGTGTPYLQPHNHARRAKAHKRRP